MLSITQQGKHFCSVSQEAALQAQEAALQAQEAALQAIVEWC